jgi:hypothetical protein
MPEHESKQDAFRRLAIQRTNAVLERLRILGRCANRQSYEYDSEDVNKIFHAIEAELRDVKAKFKDSKQNKFTL